MPKTFKAKPPRCKAARVLKIFARRLGCHRWVALTLPAAHQKRMRTSNALERLNQEFKRRTRAARVFANEKSLLRLITALLCETSDDWEAGKITSTWTIKKTAPQFDVR